MKTNQEQFLIAIARIEKFSPAPMILARAMKLLRDPQSDLASIAELVGSDPSLAANVIRCANSAYYGGGESVQSIGEAVQKIGFRETIHLLNLAVARITAGRDLGSYGIAAEEFWAESLFNGLFLRNLAKATDSTELDEAYTVGLLRFIGRLAINQAIHDRGGGVFWRGGEAIAQWELENVGFVQAQAGAILLAKWQFPEAIVQAIAGQDAPEQQSERSWLAGALHFASTLLPQGLGEPFQSAIDRTAHTLPANSNLMQHYALTPTDVAAVLTDTHQDYEQIRQHLGQ